MTNVCVEIHYFGNDKEMGNDSLLITKFTFCDQKDLFVNDAYIWPMVTSQRLHRIVLDECICHMGTPKTSTFMLSRT